MMFTAVPDLQAVASSRVGTYECEVKYSVMRPMTRPPTVPIVAHQKAFIGVPVITAGAPFCSRTPSRRKVAGSIVTARNQITGNMRNAVRIICTFSTISMSSCFFTGLIWVATKEQRMHTMMPPAEMTNGKSNASQPASVRVLLEPFTEAAAMTRAAHVLSAKDPKRSAPIPAMSPTLSPTLSAMVAGFKGSSSSRPATTLPTRSAPTSAAFV
mmetsp:Transcript_115667/g.247206  ORF Transcript_115667/g.247206 Transcript_115667/m.247206 type:complete len:213 (+) Transcript_115667:1119-1757(+)